MPELTWDDAGSPQFGGHAPAGHRAPGRRLLRLPRTGAVGGGAVRGRAGAADHGHARRRLSVHHPGRQRQPARRAQRGRHRRRPARPRDGPAGPPSRQSSGRGRPCHPMSPP
ncbi:hypothetical protein SGPA1_20420 [Streptomyces misionensis JCM 4497]